MPEWPEHQRLTYEKELLGFYLTGHPLEQYSELLQTFATQTVGTLRSGSDGDMVTCGGIIAKCRHTTTKAKNERMCIVLLEGLEGFVEVLVFPSSYQQCVRALNVGNVVLVVGRLNLREDEPKIMANDVVVANEVRSRCTEKIHVDLTKQVFDEAMMHSLRDVMQGHGGETPVWLHLAGSDDTTQCLQVQRECFVNPSEDLIRALGRCVGAEAVSVEAKPPPKNGARRRGR